MRQRIVIGFGAGALFGIGLAVSGMTKPSKVIGFLDVFGAWDPSLAFVMLGAIGVHVVALRRIGRWSSPLFNPHFHLPTRKDIDVRLVLGAAIFGVGWGLGGYCPGPGLVSAMTGALPALLFVAGMTAGMKAEHLASRAL
ncbi:MAG: YeeE/YedE family protein [Labilithrix sp.]|nr:YeeE/YedE family protein [Labilithrix sp.]MCW5813062.1 YeeE/YedE family protein [Labilithrix sp.]